MASKLSLFLANALRSAAARSPRSSIRCPPLRTLCSEATDDKEAPPNGDPIHEERTSATASPAVDQDTFSDTSVGTGGDPVFAKLTGTGRYTLKTDIMHYFEGCNITSEDIKVDYNKAYNPVGMLLRFPSRSAYASANSMLLRKGRLYKMVKIDGDQWDLTESYDGKAAVLHNIPLNATAEDIERFLCGCSFDASNLKMFTRNFPDPSKAAVVRFNSPVEAMHAFRVKNRSFCLNNTVLINVLQ